MSKKAPPSLKFKQVIDIDPAQVYSAFTSATALTEWLCNTAQVDPHPGGQIYLHWQNGYYTSGEFLSLKPGKKLAFSWRGRDEPGPTYVQVSVKPKEEGAQITLTHSGLGKGKAWKRARKEFKQGWTSSLENLKSVLETGKDQRVMQRPMLGVTGLKDVTGEQAEAYSLPKDGSGVSIQGVVEGMGVHAAGIATDDVIVQFDGQHVGDIASLIEMVRSHRASDQVKVVYYRDGKRKKTTLELSPLSMPEAPPTAQALFEEGEKMYNGCNDDLRASLEGISESEADYRPQTDDWNIKEILAHLITSERAMHSWFTSMVEDREAGFNFHVNSQIRLAAHVAVNQTLAELRAELEKSQAETLALAARLPDEFIARPRTYYRLATNLLTNNYHYQDHVAQIASLVQAAREADQ